MALRVRAVELQFDQLRLPVSLLSATLPLACNGLFINVQGESRFVLQILIFFSKALSNHKTTEIARARLGTLVCSDMGCYLCLAIDVQHIVQC